MWCSSLYLGWEEATLCQDILQGAELKLPFTDCIRRFIWLKTLLVRLWQAYMTKHYLVWQEQVRHKIMGVRSYFSVQRGTGIRDRYNKIIKENIYQRILDRCEEILARKREQMSKGNAEMALRNNSHPSPHASWAGLPSERWHNSTTAIGGFLCFGVWLILSERDRDSQVHQRSISHSKEWSISLTVLPSEKHRSWTKLSVKYAWHEAATVHTV